MDGADVVLVTVTYGDRIRFLSEMLKDVFSGGGVSSVVLVDNGSISDLKHLQDIWCSKLDIVRLGENMGAAAGFSAGIRRAVDLGASYIWLMDDDNTPGPGCCERMLEEIQKLATRVGRSNAIVCGSRGNGLDMRRAFPPPSSFMMFHVALLLYLIMKHTVRRKVRPEIASEVLSIPFCPYGGMLAPRELFEHYGMPRLDFVLYGDDVEYTERLTRRGVTINFVPDAKIIDLHKSWSIPNKLKISQLLYLKSGADFMVYYTFRNMTYIYRNIRAGSSWLYEVNKWIYIGSLFLLAIVFNGLPRFFLIMRAIADGEAGRLGINRDFPLP